MSIDFELIGIYLNAVILGHQPECMNLKVKVCKYVVIMYNIFYVRI